MNDFDLDGLFVEPRPDEDGWEAFLDLALERIGGERSPGVTNREIGELEAVLGTQLPFEIGLMLVMGVPLAEPWRQWSDPEADYAAWNTEMHAGISFDIEHNNFWFDGWGAKPDAVGEQLSVAAKQFEATVPRLFPIYGHHAVPLMAADGTENSDGNPVLLVNRAQVTRHDDLAAWMHNQFEVPLPMWPAEAREFPFWG